jgi:predicted transcriptional regulator
MSPHRPDWMTHLSRRERQILAVLYRRGVSTAAEIRNNLPQPPTYSTVRALLRTLERKGCVQHEARGLCYVFLPSVPRQEAAVATLKDIVITFFGGSPERAIQALRRLPSDPGSGWENPSGK